MPSSHAPSSSKPFAHKPPYYYRFIIGLLKPLYRLQVWHRSHKRDNYLQEVEQRFGKQYPPQPTASSIIDRRVIWCHAVSLGETNTIAPMLDVLLARGYQIWLTNTTQTGFTRGASRFAEAIAQGQLSHSYVPVDSPAVIETFLAHVQPIAALFVETELWANILSRLSQHRIPSILVNGRLSASSFIRYQKISAVSGSMMQNLTLIIAQDQESAKRFRQLGAYSAQIRVAGSLKWVINTPKMVHEKDETTGIDEKKHSVAIDRARHIRNEATKDTVAELGLLERPIWIAASTHGGEEEIVISLHRQIVSNPVLADTLLIVVPRHPERFDEVAALMDATGLKVARRSKKEPISAQTQVYLADSMGELMMWYALADVAVVGGSFVEVGGHNPVEPASVATPIIMGRYTQSCQSVVDKLASVGALYQPNNDFYRPIQTDKQDKPSSMYDSPEQRPFTPSSTDDTSLIYQQLQFWLTCLSLAQRAGQAGEQMTAQQQDVLSRQVAMIEEVIERAASSEML